jgi:hypothetical protein
MNNPSTCPTLCKLNVVRKPKEDSCNFYHNILSIRYILNECKTRKIKVNKPKDTEQFLQQLQTVSSSKKKAMNLLFEEIEQDVLEKERFIVSQIEQMKTIY